MSSVALITGGASGMGFAVAKELSQRGWRVAIVDVSTSTGIQAQKALGENALFFKADVSQFHEQQGAFETVFERFGRLDFVFANAGIPGKANFYDATHGPPDMLVLDICLNGVIYSSHLAIRFMRRNPEPGGLVISTASGALKPLIVMFFSVIEDDLTAASIYASPELPLYAAAKHGVLGLMRSMSEILRNESIRVNCILPGAIRTTLHSDDTWQQFELQDFTPVEEVVLAVMDLINDSKATGMAMEISAEEVFDRRQPGYCNATMRRIMEGKSY